MKANAQSAREMYLFINLELAKNFIITGVPRKVFSRGVDTAGAAYDACQFQVDAP